MSTGRGIHPPTHTFERPPGFPYWTLALIVTGRSLMSAGGREALKQAPMLTVVAPGSPYRVRFGGGRAPWNECWAIFSERQEWNRYLALPTLAPLAANYRALAINDPIARAGIVRAFNDACDTAHAALPQREALAINAIEKVLLLADTINPSAAHACLDPRVREVVEHIAANLHQPLTVADLAERVHMSPSHFAHLFREQIGRSPIDHLEQQRIARAQELLIATNLPIREVAEQVGYPNAFHFSTRFRKRIGRPPRAFRENPTA